MKKRKRVRQPTVDDWLALLPIVASPNRRWHETKMGLGSIGRIRCRRGDCPLIAIAREIDPTLNDHFLNSDVDRVLDDLGLSGQAAAVRIIVDAADLIDSPLPAVTRTRERLKAALGITGAPS